ncbi:MAG: hypothetical protein ACRDRO_30645 [Pseudonocardiaceae bacterium]
MLTPADVAFVDPGRGRGPTDRLGLALKLRTLPWLGFVPEEVRSVPSTAVTRCDMGVPVDGASADARAGTPRTQLIPSLPIGRTAMLAARAGSSCDVAVEMNTSVGGADAPICGASVPHSWKWNSTVRPIVRVLRSGSSRSESRPAIFVPKYCCGDDLRYKPAARARRVVLISATAVCPPADSHWSASSMPLPAGRTIHSGTRCASSAGGCHR